MATVSWWHGMIPAHWLKTTDSKKQVVLRSTRDNGQANILPPTHTIYSSVILDAIECIHGSFYYNTVFYDYRYAASGLSLSYNAILVVQRKAMLTNVKNDTAEYVDSSEIDIYVDSRTSVDNGTMPRHVINFYAADEIALSSSISINNASYAIINIVSQEDTTRRFYQAQAGT
jgi:hypothetical protein